MIHNGRTMARPRVWEARSQVVGLEYETLAVRSCPWLGSCGVAAVGGWNH